MQNLESKILILLCFIVLASSAFAQNRAGGGGRGGRWGDERGTLEPAILQAIGAAAQNHASNCRPSELAEIIHSLLASQRISDVTLTPGSSATPIGEDSNRCLNEALTSLVRESKVSQAEASQISTNFRN
jgi:hypothetical protein